MIEIRLEGPAKNALGTPLLIDLASRLEAAGDQPVLITGAGDAFSAGLDLKEIATLDPAGMQTFLRRLGRVVDLLFRHPGPTVAAVNGHAIAGGCILAAVCDHRVGPDRGKALIGLNEVALGLRFPPGLLEILRSRVPRIEAVILGAALHAPPQALALGLLDELADDPLAVGRARLEALSAAPRAAYSAVKGDLRRRIGADPESERIFLEEVLPVWTSAELRERIRAFLGRKG